VRPSKQGIVVSRSYSPALDKCARALELLLQKTVIEGGPANRPDARKEDPNASGNVSISR
jgi:hypothetical protein